MQLRKVLIPALALVLLGAGCKATPNPKGGVTVETQGYKDAQYTGEVVQFLMEPTQIDYDHHVGINSCPDKIPGGLDMTGPANGSWVIDKGSVPGYMNIPDYPEDKGKFPADGKLHLNLQFNCMLKDYSTHNESATLKAEGFDSAGKSVGMGEVKFNLHLNGQ